MKKFCTNCGKESNKKVCTHCGVKKGKTHKFCAWCGNELPENAAKCTSCNEKTKNNKFLSLIAFICEAILMITFLIHLSGNEAYKSALLYPIVLLGTALAFPIWRTVIKNITHKTQKLRTPLQFVRYLAVCALVTVLYSSIIPMGEYDFAVKTATTDPVQARQLFLALDGYKDSDAKANEMTDVIFNNAKIALDNYNWKEAEQLLENIPEYSRIDEIKAELMYQKGVAALNNYQYALAKHCFKDIATYKDVSTLKMNTGIGLAGNSYNYTSTSYGPVQVSSYSLFFNDNWLEESSPATVRQLVIHTPKLYAGGIDMDVDGTWQYRIINDTFYKTSANIAAPENLNEWITADYITSIVWDGDRITSFVIDGMQYTINSY